MIANDMPYSSLLWQQLYDKAETKVKEGNHKAKDTLKSLGQMKEACDHIVSGKAKDKAVKAERSARSFLKRRASPENVMEYCQRVLGYPGPHSVTIRKHKEWLAYIDARNDEADSSGKPARPSNHQKEISKALDRMTLMDDRDLLQREVELGRKAQAELNTLLHFVTQLAPVNLDRLKDGRLDTDSMKSAQVGLDMKSRTVISGLVARLTDNDFLSAFELVFNGKSIDLGYGSRSKFISLNEMALLKRLGGIADIAGGDDDDCEPVM